MFLLIQIDISKREIYPISRFLRFEMSQGIEVDNDGMTDAFFFRGDFLLVSGDENLSYITINLASFKNSSDANFFLSDFFRCLSEGIGFDLTIENLKKYKGEIHER